MFATLMAIGLLQNIHLRTSARWGSAVGSRPALDRSRVAAASSRVPGVRADVPWGRPRPRPEVPRHAATAAHATAPASVFPRLEPLLPTVQKPIQYVGGELNSTQKEWDEQPRSAGR